MNASIIPLAAYRDIDCQLCYHADTVDIDDLAELIEPLGEGRFFALLNCLTATQVTRSDLRGSPTPRNLASFMIEQLNASTYIRNNPLNPRNSVNWERMHHLVTRHSDIGEVVSLLLGRDLRNPEGLFCKESVAFKMTGTEGLERHTNAHIHYVKCPVQDCWVSEPIFHSQFLVSCIGIDRAISNDKEHGLLNILLDDAAQWLISHEGQGEIQMVVKHFNRTLAYGKYSDNQISWQYALNSDRPSSFKTLDSGKFLSYAHESANKAGLNHRKKAYLASALDI